MALFNDSIKDIIYGERLSNNIYRDNNGQLICENAVIARTGYYDYLESEINPNGSPDKVVRVYRSPEEVFNKDSMNSMNYKPLVDEHPEDNVTPETVGELQKGFMTNIRKGVGEYEDSLLADIIISDPLVIDEVLSGNKRELSVGYTADIEERGGQYYMTNIRGNHLALCSAGRAGTARIRDSKSLSISQIEDWLKMNKSECRAAKNQGSGVLEEKIKRELLGGAWSGSDRANVATAIEHVFGDSSVFDYEAKGSFNSLRELKGHYGGAVVSESGNDVTVSLTSGEKLLYSYLNGSHDKLLFVRRLRDSVEVIGDSVKFREGQRVEFFGTNGVISNISASGRGFLVEVSKEGGSHSLLGRYYYEELEDYVKSGEVKLLDSVVLDEDTKEFKFKSNEDFSDCFIDKVPDDPADEKELDRTHFIEGADEVPKREYKVVKDGRSFLVKANSHYDAVSKVAAVVKDAQPKKWTLYSPSEDTYVGMQTTIRGDSLDGIYLTGKGYAQRWSSPTLAESYAIAFNEVMRRNGHKGDFKAIPLNDDAEYLARGEKQKFVREVIEVIKRQGVRGTGVKVGDVGSWTYATILYDTRKRSPMQQFFITWGRQRPRGLNVKWGSVDSDYWDEYHPGLNESELYSWLMSQIYPFKESVIV